MKKITTSQSPLISYLEKKGAKVSILEGTEVVYVQIGSKKHIFINSYSPLVPQNIGLFLSNKHYVNSLLKSEKISVPEAILVSVESKNRVLKTTTKMGYPLIFSDNSSQSFLKSELVATEEKVDRAFDFFKDKVAKILIQKYHKGKDYRIFYSETGYFQVLREKHTMNLYTGKQVVEREDVTRIANKELKKLAKKILQIFQPMFYVSFRLMLSEDISKNGKAIVTEVYHSASPHYGKFAHKGKVKKDVIEILGDQLLK